MTEQQRPPSSNGASRARAHDGGADALNRLAEAYVENRPDRGEVAEWNVRDAMAEAFSAGWTQRGLSRPDDRSSGRPLCASCDHWDSVVDRPSELPGLCRLGAATLLQNATTNTGYWPEVQPSDWCGQHSALQLVITGEPVREITEGDGLPIHVLLGTDDPTAVHPAIHELAVEQAAQELGATPDDLIPGTWHWNGRELTGNQLLDAARQHMDAKLADVVPMPLDQHSPFCGVQHGGFCDMDCGKMDWRSHHDEAGQFPAPPRDGPPPVRRPVLPA